MADGIRRGPEFSGSRARGRIGRRGRLAKSLSENPEGRLRRVPSDRKGLASVPGHRSFTRLTRESSRVAPPRVRSCGLPFATRTVVVPHRAEPGLLRALLDTRAAVNSLIPDWRAHPEESRFESTKRSYPSLRARYPHLASGWAMTVSNETVAVLNAWDRSVRRARREDPERFERMRRGVPSRQRLKASLHRNLFSLRDGHLRITLHKDRHVDVDLTAVPNPLFARYGEASGWVFGLTVTPKRLRFHFRVPHEIREVPETAGIDLNFAHAVVATSDGAIRAVDLTPVLRIQANMDRKRHSVARTLSTEQRHQKAVLKRHGRRERRRTDAQLHTIANTLVSTVGERAVVVEDLRGIAPDQMRRTPHRSSESRQRLSRWTHGRLVTMLAYKIHTPIVRVNPEGTSQECPRCGGRTALPREEGRSGEGHERHPRMTRRTVCESCGSEWHRDAAAAIAVLARGRSILRGAPVPPSARNGLLEAAGWRSEAEGLRSLIAEPRKGDDAKPGPPPRRGGVFG
jgi:IS605 OrfB family transposase